MEALSDQQIRRSFVNCSRGLADRITLPADFGTLPWAQLDFLGWHDPKIPAQAYIVVPQGDRLVGMLLRSADAATRRKGSGLCNLCHSARTANDVLLFAAPRAGASGRAGNTVGTYICADLRCSLYARGMLKLPLPQAESGSPELRSELLRDRLGDFVARMLEQ